MIDYTCGLRYPAKTQVPHASDHWWVCEINNPNPNRGTPIVGRTHWNHASVFHPFRNHSECAKWTTMRTTTATTTSCLDTWLLRRSSIAADDGVSVLLQQSTFIHPSYNVPPAAAQDTLLNYQRRIWNASWYEPLLGIYEGCGGGEHTVVDTPHLFLTYITEPQRSSHDFINQAKENWNTTTKRDLRNSSSGWLCAAYRSSCDAKLAGLMSRAHQQMLMMMMDMFYSILWWAMCVCVCVF